MKYQLTARILQAEYGYGQQDLYEIVSEYTKVHRHAEMIAHQLVAAQNRIQELEAENEFLTRLIPD